MNLVDWAQVVGAAGSLFAVVVSLGVHFHQRARDSKATKRADAAVLLSLQNLAGELRRMNVLAGFQLDAKGNEVFYPNIAAEFAAVSRMLEELPIERISVLGKMPMVLHLRRVAAELVMLYTPQPPVGSNFYRNNRERFGKLEKTCGTYAQQLMGEIERLDAEVYEANLEQMQKL